VQTVLGFATTQTTIDFVRVEGFGADGANVTRDSLRTQNSETASEPYAQLLARVWFRMRRVARANDHQVRSVGVTWSHGAAHEASLLVEALTAAGLHNVVAVEAGKASEELDSARESAKGSSDPEPTPLVAVDEAATNGDHTPSSVDDLMEWLDTVIDESQPALALGAALASAHGAGPPHVSRMRRPWLRPPRAPSPTKAGMWAGALVLLVLLSVTAGVRPTSEAPSRPVQHPADITSGGPAVVPADPVHAVQAPLPKPPSAPAPAVAPDTAGGSPSLPAAVVPEPPAGAPSPVPLVPAPQLAPVPAPGDQLPPPIPGPAPGEQAPGSNCVLLCGIAI
jgi:hypothetical protein